MTNPISKTLVIIPVFNEEKNIGRIVKEIYENFPHFHVAVINDGSTDDTCEIAKSELAYVINHPFNMGYGVSIQTGYKFAFKNKYEYLIQLDGDGQHDIKCIEKIYKKLEEGKYDLVLGSRFADGGIYSPGFLRYCGMKVFRSVVNTITGLKLSDITTGFQGMNRKTLHCFVKDLFPFDFPDADVLVLAHKRGLRICEVPVTMYENATGKSMHSSIFGNIMYVVQMFIALFILMLRKEDD